MAGSSPRPHWPKSRGGRRADGMTRNRASHFRRPGKASPVVLSSRHLVILRRPSPGAAAPPPVMTGRRHRRRRRRRRTAHGRPKVDGATGIGDARPRTEARRLLVRLAARGSRLRRCRRGRLLGADSPRRGRTTVGRNDFRTKGRAPFAEGSQGRGKLLSFRPEVLSSCGRKSVTGRTERGPPENGRTI